MKKNNFYLSLLFLFFSCDTEPTNVIDNDFSINFISPSSNDNLVSYPINIILSINNKDAVESIDFFINDNHWCSPSPEDTININYYPSNSSSDIKIKAYAKNGFMEYSDSISFTYMSDSLSFFNDPTLSFVTNNDLSLSIMKFPVTNQLYAKYLQLAYRDSLINFNNDSESFTGYFSGTDLIEAGNYDFYIIENGKLEYNNSLISIIDTSYNTHPASGVTWIGAMSFAQYFGWRLPTWEEWNNFSVNDSIKIDINKVNYQNNFNSTTPAGYFNGTNKGVVKCTEDFHINGLYDLIGNVWEYTSTPAEFDPEFIITYGGDFTSQLSDTTLLSDLKSSVPFNYGSSNFGFRCIAETNPVEINTWNGPDGGASNDLCGICSGGNSGHIANSDQDCEGECFGDAIEDCSGLCNGGAIKDECGTCDSDPSNDCIQDCAGIWGGTTTDEECGNCQGSYDDCGVCDGDNSTCEDCAGVPNGNAIINEICGCYGGTTNKEYNWCIGCLDYQSNNFMLGESCCTQGISDIEQACVEISNNVETNCELSIADSTNNYSAGFTGVYFDNLINDLSECNYSACNQDASLSLTYNPLTNTSGTLDIYLNNSVPIYGFQFDLQGIIINDINDGRASDAGFSSSNQGNRIIGFSFSGASIAAGSGVLMNLSVDLSTNTRVCFDGNINENNIIISGEGGSQINACPEKTQSSCLTICGDGICNFSELGECEQDCTE